MNPRHLSGIGRRLRGLGVPVVSPRYEALARQAADEVLVTSPEGTVRFLSPSFSRRWNLDRWALLGMDAFDWIHPDDRDRAREALRRACLPGAAPVDSEHRYLVLRTGEVRWVRVRFSDARHERSVAGVIWNCVDTTEEKHALEALRFVADHDRLTGLPNRRSLFEALATARAAGATCGLVLIGLDGLRAVNDRLGHSAGDDVVRRTAERLTRVAGGDAVVARLDGDEFALLVTGTERVVGQAVAVLGERCVRAVREPVAVGGRSVVVTAGVGTALAGPAGGPDRPAPADPDGHDRVRELFGHADVALTAAKAAGGDRAVPFSRSLLDARHERAELAADLRQAVGQGQLRVVYQPLVDLAAGSTVGVEALVRWEHPRRGTVSPAVFVPVAEESGTILELGAFVLDEALGAAAGFRAAAGGGVLVSVNLSAHQLLQPGLDGFVADALARHAVDPAVLCLEVTESAAVADLSAARETLLRLRSLGVQTALDDFGTGYSSLSYLRRLPVDKLKIDKSFLDDVADDQGVAVLSGIAALASGLGLTTVAEGIETDQVARLVARAGCTWGQGYHFARPLPEQQAREHLARRPGREGPQNPLWRSTTA
ncbi:putative bifunctional diguanylate cyclase/phosphodiesterase [Kineococcus sp. LSe6-4]|uniref:Bifunctional diguanylate cyclase/phosphodiesterase n=1 Tax=Kineococcus halophytocola TaxID=3234027 RepID=A0ABV4H5L8_9ACTN